MITQPLPPEDTVKGEHLKTDTLKEGEFYPDHGVRTESTTFVRTKKAGHAAGLRCAVTGQPVGQQYHHIFCEWALAGAVDWATVKGVATGQIATLPVLDLQTHLPTGDTYPVEQSLLWMVLQITKARGFDWGAFDPSNPEQFVDSMANMLVLHETLHIGAQHGIHEKSLPVWAFHMFPRVAGFVYTPDEEAAILRRIADSHR